MSTQERWIDARVERIEDLGPTIRLFEIVAPSGMEPWRPGAHLGVRVTCNGQQEKRSYSLLDLGPEQGDGGRYRIAVKRRDGGLGGSRYMWSLAVGGASRSAGSFASKKSRRPKLNMVAIKFVGKTSMCVL